MNKSSIRSNIAKSKKTTNKASENVSMTVMNTSGVTSFFKILMKIIILIVMGVFILFPFYYMISMSFMDHDTISQNGGVPLFPSDPTFGNYVWVFTRGYLTAVIFSLFVMFTNVVLKVVICITIGYAFAMYDFKLKRTIWALLMMTMAIPEVALISAQYDVVVNLGLNSGLKLLVGLAAPFVAQIFTIYMFRNGFEAIPDSVKEAAMIDGISETTFFFKVAIPMISSTIWTVVILTAFASWNSYIWPSLLLGTNSDFDTITLWLFSASKDDIAGRQYENYQMAAATLTIAPTIIIYLIFKKKIDNTVAASGGDKG